MSERELQEAVIDMAHVFGWKVAHFRPAQNSRGDWRTPVAADGKGFPDLVMVSAHAIFFIELKSEKGRLTPEQRDWLDRLSHKNHDWDWNEGCTLNTMVWKPDHWKDGTIEKLLREWS